VYYFKKPGMFFIENKTVIAITDSLSLNCRLCVLVWCHYLTYQT